MAKNILEIKNLTFSFHTYGGVVKSVRDVSFNVREGEILGIVGESGCFNVTVKDKYNNETKKTGKVTVIAKPVISNNEEVVHETVKNKDGSTSVKTKVQKKIRVLIQIELLLIVLLQTTIITVLLEVVIVQVILHQEAIKDL